MTEQNSNGNHDGTVKIPKQRVVIEQDPLTRDFHVDVEPTDIELGMDLCARAYRHLEARFRFDQATKLRGSQLQAVADAALAKSIMGGK